MTGSPRITIGHSVLLAIGILCPFSSDGCEDRIGDGTVIEISGYWMITRNPVLGGQEVFSGNVLRLEGRGATGSLEIAMHDGHRLTIRAGTIRSVEIPRLRDDRLPATERIVRAVGRVLRRQQEKFTTTATRGIEPSSLRAGVVRLAEGSIEFGPAAPRFPARSARSLELLALDPATLAPTGFRTSVPLPGSPVNRLTTPGDLREGLYQARVLVEADHKLREAPGKYYLIVASGEIYSAAATNFRKALELVDGWGASTPDGIRNKFLQAYAVALAAEGVAGHQP